MLKLDPRLGDKAVAGLSGLQSRAEAWQVRHHYPEQVRQEYWGQGSQDITEWVGKSRFHRDREQVLAKPD